jgi:membrane fusion protein (multidrug efflux system)
MKNYLLISSVIILITACGKGDKQEQLRALQAKRDALNAQIEQLKEEIGSENIPENTEKLAFVELRKIKPVLFHHYIKIQGEVASDNNILIPAQSSGVVKKIYVNEGDRVKAGQMLAELDGAILESTIAELKTNLELARTVYERQERLWNKKIGSEIQYLQAKTNKEALEKKLDTVQEQYRLTKIISPIDGTVDQILIKESEATAAGFGTIRVVKITDLKIQAFLSENYIDQVHVGDSVTVNIPVMNRTFKSRLSAVSQVIDQKNRTFPIEVKIPSDIKEIKPNMLTVLTVNDYTNSAAYTVPVDAIQATGKGDFLFTAVPSGNGSESWTVKRAPVTTALDYNNEVEISHGLQAGDHVVIRGQQNLADGQKVMIATNQK